MEGVITSDTTVDAATGRNGPIDGWRGLSVLLVVIGHLMHFRFEATFRIIPFRVALNEHPVVVTALAKHIFVTFLAPFSLLGVNVFFVMSGFLITDLLCREERLHGRISLPAFYVRRAGRILPALGLYMAALFALKTARAIAVPNEEFLWSGLHLCNVAVGRCGWWLGHTWSLGVEEQFYLVWPVLFLVTPAHWRARVLGALLLLFCMLSFVWIKLVSFGFIAAGVLYAVSDARVRLDQFFRTRWIVFALIVLFVQPFTAASIAYPLIEAIRPVLVALVVFATIEGIGPTARVVRWSWLQRLGLVSYSVYLWQQLSTAPREAYADAPLLVIPVLFLIPALLSYRLVEQPMIRIARRISQRWTNRGAVSIGEFADRHA